MKGGTKAAAPAKVFGFGDAARIACREFAEADPRSLSALSLEAGHGDNWYARKLVDGQAAPRALALEDVDELAGVLSIPVARIAERTAAILEARRAELAAKHGVSLDG